MTGIFASDFSELTLGGSLEETPWFKCHRVDRANPDRTVDVLLAVLLLDDDGDDDDGDDQGGDGGDDDYVQSGDDDDVVAIYDIDDNPKRTLARKHLLLKKLTTSFVSTWMRRNQGEGGHFKYVMK